MKVTIQECSAEEEEEVIIRCRGIDERNNTGVFGRGGRGSHYPMPWNR